MKKPEPLLAALLLACVIFPAAADDGKPRYVAGNGRDVGDCQNRFRPCRTLSYAIAQGGKADSIQVAEGRYNVENAQQLLDIVSASGRVSGGYKRVSSYSERGASGDTVLAGVPPEFRERFEAAGFTVIADAKGLEISDVEAQRMRKLTIQMASAEQSHALTPCVSGRSGDFACQAVSLLSHLSLQDLRPASNTGNDVWGFTDLNTGREYVFMGLQNGVAILDITNPEAPEPVAAPTGSGTTWRDITVYQLYDESARRWRAYAYISADNVTDRPIVLDLSGLPNGVERVDWASDVRAAHNIYLTNADFTYGIVEPGFPPQLSFAGASLSAGRYRLYSLADPRAPSLVNVSTTGYAHEIMSFAVDDDRKNTQCFNALARDSCRVLSDYNENTLDLWDISSPATPQLLSSVPYQNAAYVHSGWSTENGRHLLVHDELDEQNFGLNTIVRVFDLSDLRAPQMIGAWNGPTRAIDHNGAVRGNRYYISNYSEGLTILDLTDPTAPTRVGFFDTFPASAQTGFVGAWGVYPFFASGTIAISDINSGLYLLRNETLATPRGSFVMANAAATVNEGQDLTITVNRTGGTERAVSVDVDAVFAVAQSNDATLITPTTLNWLEGDSTPKTVTLRAHSDVQPEDLEMVLVRLRNPQGGATISYPDTSAIAIGDGGRATALRSLQSAPIVEEGRGKVLIPVTRHASATGEARVSYRTLTGGTFSGFTATQGELVWPDGDTAAKTVSVSINSTALSAGQSGTFQVELFNAVNASIENASGTVVTALPLTVTVNDPATPPQQPPQNPPAAPAGGGGGGGALSLLWLALLSGFVAAPIARRSLRRACAAR
jgi:choice-of-anchor B domain-containing protein